MASHEIKHKASVRVELGEPSVAMGDESRLTQVLVNLLVNAAQAFESNDLYANLIYVRSRYASDGRVVVEVEDTGPGIPLSLQKRVFDPFFTTKPVGQGTGLGLSVSRNIAAALGAELRLVSAEGGGTTFSLVLPPVSSVAVSQPTPRPMAPRARILLIDDEVTVLNSIRRILAREHEVVSHIDPREALAQLQGGAQFDLVLCDLMMPFITGQELYERVAKTDPEQASRFVFVTGGATDPLIAAFLASVPNERLDKPFVSAALSSIARRFALRTRGPAAE
jgi:CheY-like chemotaxis protein/anti-sigma regulatory factor (Ser/Thr protein kinase)